MWASVKVVPYFKQTERLTNRNTSNNILSKQRLISVCKTKRIGYVIRTEKSLPINKVNREVLEFQKQRQMRVQRRHTHRFSFSDIFYFDLVVVIVRAPETLACWWLLCFESKRTGGGWGTQVISKYSQSHGLVILTESSTALGSSFSLFKILCTS